MYVMIVCRSTAASFVLLTTSLGVAQGVVVNGKKSAEVKRPEIKEVLTLTNGDTLTGELLSSNASEIKFKSNLAGEVTVKWEAIKELKSERSFAVIPLKIKDSRNSASVPQGAIRFDEKTVTVSPAVPGKHEANSLLSVEETKAFDSTQKMVEATVIPSEKIGYIIDDVAYQREINRKIHWTSGWDGHISTGSTKLPSTQTSFLRAGTGSTR